MTIFCKNLYNPKLAFNRKQKGTRKNSSILFKIKKNALFNHLINENEINRIMIYAQLKKDSNFFIFIF